MSRVETALLRLRESAARIESPLRPPIFGPPCTEAEVEELLGRAAPRLGEYCEYLRLCRRVDAADVHAGYFLFSPIRIAARDSSEPRRLHVQRGGMLDEVAVMGWTSPGSVDT